MKKRILAIFMTLALLLTLMPVMSFAEPAHYSSVGFKLKKPVDESRFEWEDGEYKKGLDPVVGDVLTVDGTDYTFVEDESTDEWFYGFRDKDGNPFWNWRIVFKKADGTGSYLENWELGVGKYKAYMMIFEEEEISPNHYVYYGNEKYAFIHDVTIRENRVESIKYIPSKTYYTVSEINRFKSYSYGYAEYNIPVGMGDQLAIKYKGKATKYIPMTKNEYGDYVFVVPAEAGLPEETIYAGMGTDFDTCYLSYYTMSKGHRKPEITGTDRGVNYEFAADFVDYNNKLAATDITVSTLTQSERREWFGNQSSKVPAVKKAKYKAAKKKVTVSWKKATKKNLKKFTKVEVQVCKDKSFQKANTKRVLVKKSKKSTTIKKLKKGTYYVRVRNVKGSGPSKLVSKWSKVKKVKVK